MHLQISLREQASERARVSDGERERERARERLGGLGAVTVPQPP